MEQEFELIAKTFMGLEPVLAQELTQLGANNVQIGRRVVSFTGNKEMMYRANFQLHTAIRILKPIAHFKAASAEDMYEEVKKIDWSKYLDNKLVDEEDCAYKFRSDSMGLECHKFYGYSSFVIDKYENNSVTVTNRGSKILFKLES